MIKIRDLSFTYPSQNQPNLKNITLDIEKGDFLAVIGNNGCGKSTLCKILNGLIPHFFNGEFRGDVEVCGLNTKEYNIGDLANKIGYVYQDFENQIVRPTVIDDASYACLNYAMEDYIDKGREALKTVGLINKENDYIWQLSGGQKHLLALAGIVALSPEIIVLDEPIAQIDPRHAKEIYETLKYLNRELGKTIIVIEHHTEFIAKYCKNVVMMKNGEILWKLSTKKALNRVEELEESCIFPPQVTIAGKLLRDRGIIDIDRELPTTIEEGREFFNHLKLKENEVSMDEYKGGEERVVTFEEVEVKYRAVKGRDKKILDKFSLEIRKGERIVLIGSNGAGKSTIMKLMIGLLKPSKGDIKIYGNSIKKMNPEEIAKKLSFVYQNPEEMFIKDTILGDIEYAMKVRAVDNYKEKAEELLNMFNLKEIENRDGRLLSGGQMRRASLAIGIALNPAILLLDEPTANLDIATRKEIIKTMERLKGVVETVMIATHDMQLVSEWADRIIVLNRGEIVADGKREEVFNNRLAIESAGICPPEIYNMGKLLDRRAECFTVDEFIESFKLKEEEECLSFQKVL